MLTDARSRVSISPPHSSQPSGPVRNGRPGERQDHRQQVDEPRPTPGGSARADDPSGDGARRRWRRRRARAWRCGRAGAARGAGRRAGQKRPTMSPSRGERQRRRAAVPSAIAAASAGGGRACPATRPAAAATATQDGDDPPQVVGRVPADHEEREVRPHDLPPAGDGDEADAPGTATQPTTQAGRRRSSPASRRLRNRLPARAQRDRGHRSTSARRRFTTFATAEMVSDRAR